MTASSDRSRYQATRCIASGATSASPAVTTLTNAGGRTRVEGDGGDRRCGIGKGDDDINDFAFQASTQPVTDKKASTSALLVDSGTLVHVITDKSKFMRFNEDSEADRQIMQLADVTRQVGTVLARVMLVRCCRM